MNRKTQGLPKNKRRFRLFMCNLFDFRAVRFLIVGVCNTALASLCIVLFYNFFGMGYWLSTSASYLIGSLFSFIMNRQYTFQKQGGIVKHFLRFVMNIAVCYLITFWIARMVSTLVLSPYGDVFREHVAMFLGLFLFAVLNYIGQRYYVF